MTGPQGGGAGDIDEAEAHVRRLERELTEARKRLVSVQSDRARPHTPQQAVSSKSTVREKVALFRDLFRGRADVYATYWHNSRSGQSGYSPARSGNSSEKSQRSYLGVTDQVIEDHLRGRHVVGVYPLLPDDTCWLLAADFDGAPWTEDVGAFIERGRAACDSRLETLFLTMPVAWRGTLVQYAGRLQRKHDSKPEDGRFTLTAEPRS